MKEEREVDTQFDDVVSDFGRDILRAAREEEIELKEEKIYVKRTRDDCSSEGAKCKAKCDVKLGGGGSFCTGNESDWAVDSEAGEPDSAAVTHKVETCGASSDVRTRRAEDLFSETTSTEGSEGAGGRTAILEFHPI